MTIPARTEAIKLALPGSGRGQTYGQLGVGQSIYEQSLTPTTTVGKRLKVGNRTFHYAHAEGAVTAGKMAVYAIDTDVETTVTVAHGIGTTECTVTAQTAIVKDQYAEGMLFVHGTGGTGVGDQYVVKSHPAIAAGATGTITIYEPGLLTAWATASTDVTLVSNPYFGVAQSTAITSVGAGVPLIDITDEYWFWLQTWGPAAVLIKTAATSGVATGEQAMSVNTAGDLYPQIAGHAQSAVSLRVTLDATATDADFGYVMLRCDP